MQTSIESEPTVSWHRTHEGLLAGQAASLAFLAVPWEAGNLRIAIAYDIDKPPATWTPDDFLMIGTAVTNETAFRDQVAALARQQHEAASFCRREIAPGTETPWGKAQFSRRYAAGVVLHETAGHGGFHLDPPHNALVDPAYRDAEGWYEKDCEWAKVAATFPLLFAAGERQAADGILRDYEPQAYEAVNGITLSPGESYAKDEQAVLNDHADDWLVLAAITSSHRPGFIECIATLGGNRSETDERRYLVPNAEYEPSYFVIDQSRHEAYFGPSDFPRLAQVQQDGEQPVPAPAKAQEPHTATGGADTGGKRAEAEVEDEAARATREIAEAAKAREDAGRSLEPNRER
jgi:hypothetical protein